MDSKNGMGTEREIMEFFLSTTKVFQYILKYKKNFSTTRVEVLSRYKRNQYPFSIQHNNWTGSFIETRKGTSPI